ncbi:hypothetical protein AB0L05_10885, partial [Nonomuraea pusilla]
MSFGVLGPLAVWADGGEAVRVGEPKARLLLAALLARGGGPVPADRLVDDLWGVRPLRNPAGTRESGGGASAISALIWARCAASSSY